MCRHHQPAEPGPGPGKRRTTLLHNLRKNEAGISNKAIVETIIVETILVEITNAAEQLNLAVVGGP